MQRVQAHSGGAVVVSFVPVPGFPDYSVNRKDEVRGKNLMMKNNGRRKVRACRSCHNARTLARYYERKGNGMTASENGR